MPRSPLIISEFIAYCTLLVDASPSMKKSLMANANAAGHIHFFNAMLQKISSEVITLRLAAISMLDAQEFLAAYYKHLGSRKVGVHVEKALQYLLNEPLEGGIEAVTIVLMRVSMCGSDGAAAHSSENVGSGASPLLSFVNRAYQGEQGIDVESILREINQQFSRELAPIVILPENRQLQFLYVSLSEVYLQNRCTGLGCRFMPMVGHHTVADHLQQLFFQWVLLQYPGMKSQWLLSDDNSDKLAAFMYFLILNNDDPKCKDIALNSMLATIYPLIMDADGEPGFDICGSKKKTYDFLQHQHPHPHQHPQKKPYVRLGGNLRRAYFDLDCRGFDMRGADLQNSACFSREYLPQINSFKTPSSDDMLKYHANFSDADLRYANLNHTEFRLRAALVSTRLENTSQRGSNITGVLQGCIAYYDRQRHSSGMLGYCNIS